MRDRAARADRDEIEHQLQALRADRQRRVETMLHREIGAQAPGNALYWIAVVGGSFLLNLGLLLMLAR
jgi:hypothetical protein